MVSKIQNTENLLNFISKGKKKSENKRKNLDTAKLEIFGLSSQDKTRIEDKE